MDKPLKIIYVYDALCGWCYGFSQVIKECFEKHKNDFEFEVLSGGMMIGERVGSINEIAPFIKTAYHSVESTTGIKFGESYLRHLEKGTMILDSEKPSIALSVFKTYYPEMAIPYVHDLQNAIYFDGKNPNEYEIYRYLAVNFSIDPDEFEAKMKLDSSKESAYYDFALVRQLRVESFPAVLIQTSDTGFYLIAKGFTELDTLEVRLNNVLKELKDSEN